MIEFELDIPLLTQDGLQMSGNVFDEVKELTSSSMIEWIDNDWDADSLDQFIRQKSTGFWSLNTIYSVLSTP